MANTYNVCNKLQAIADAITQGGGGGGGTTVIANPSGTPTADLNTVQIGQVIYDIPGGGGGSGYSETTLWSGAPTTTSITLTDSVLNYDAIYVEAKFNNEAYVVNTIDKATFVSYLGNDYISLGSHANTYFGINPTSTATHFVFFGANYNGCTRVIGLKYARGGGSDQAVDINYDNTVSGLTATNVQDAIDENADNISTLNSKTLKLLWNNANPTASFLPQQIALSSSDYDYLIIYCNFTQTLSSSINILKGIGGDIVAISGSNKRIYRRFTYVDDTHLDVAACYSDTSIENGYFIPAKIYGGKF